MSTGAPAPCDAAQAAAHSRRGGAHPGATLAASILGSSLAFIDGSVVNVALPAMGEGLKARADGLAWIVSAYLLTLSALILLGGALGDRFGRRRVFLIGIAIFLGASVGFAVAPDLGTLIAARAVQGAGAALLMPNSLALLGAAFDGDAKGRAVGTWAGAGALAGALGPVLGGWLVEAAGWRSIFLLNLPVGLGAAALAWRFVAESHGRDDARLDAPGALLITLALGMVTFALTAASAPSGRNAAVLLAGGVGLAALAGFVWRERRPGEGALMPLAFFRDRAFVGVTLLTLLLYAALGGLIVLLPFTLMRADGYSPVAAGAAMLPIPVLIGLGSRVMGGVSARFGARWPLGAGALIVAIGLALYVRLGGTGGYWLEVAPATLVVALGMAISVAPLTATVIGSVDADHVGAASGFNSAVARTGGLIATALLGFVFAASGSREGLLASARTAALIGAGAAAAAAACAFTLIGPLKPKGVPHG